ncbi:MAG TPA: ATP-binding protein [Prolixibacteraceae bacterium]|nr:ATP-binding protein [Prolixibacteraceae bacterium]
MRRDIYKALCNWKSGQDRRPLLIRGARQTGKTYLVNEFGKSEYRSQITLNFERNPEFKDIFSTYDPHEILEKISLYTGKKTEPNETLLFLDEIQECPKAITSLRYFYEEMPSIHIIAAGSLLEFTLSSENFKMPVGRIQYLFLFPLSFGEFLTALAESELRVFLTDISNLENLTENLHIKLIEYVRKYFIIGGMPAVVQEYIATRNILDCQRIQRSILDTYTDDFAKYARKSKHQYLKKIFNSVPGMVGQKFVYSQVDREIKSRELKEALELLETAGVVSRVRQTCGAGLPLAASINETYFKVLFLDVGLLHAISGIYADTAKEKDLTAIFKGAVAEQFAGQELISHQNPFTKPTLYYWGRQAKNSTAEIDYLIELDAQIVPIEIKSGSTGRMKSLHLFIENYHTTRAFKISQAPFLAGKPIISLPFYAIESYFNY